MREEAEEFFDEANGILIILSGKVSHPTLFHMDLGSAQEIGSDGPSVLGLCFAYGRLDHIRAGDMQVACAFGHEDEVSNGGRVDRTSGAGSHDCRDLRDDTGGEGIS